MHDFIRGLVIQKLKDAGWISNARVFSQDGPAEKVVFQIEWTDYGKERRRLLHDIFCELGYESAYRVGEFETLHQLCRISPQEDSRTPTGRPKSPGP